MTRSPLTVGLALSVLLYHGANFVLKKRFEPSRNWRPSTVAVEIEGRERIAVPTWAAPADTVFRPIDFSSDAASALGFWLGYEGGRIPDWLFLGQSTPYQRIYLRSEIPFQYPSAVERVKAGFVPAVKALVERLEPNGVTVVLLPVPTKIAMERERLPATLPDADPWRTAEREPEDPYRVYRTLVDSFPKNAVDLELLYDEYRRLHSSDELFVAADTHWSSLGIALAVKGVARLLAARGLDVTEPATLRAGERAPDPDWDLLRPLRLPRSFVFHSASFGWREPLYDVTPATKKAVPPRRIYVAGTCYTQRLSGTRYSLTRELARALGGIGVESAVAAGSVGDSLLEMRNREWVLGPGDILVWEFPIRSTLKPGETVALPLVQETVRSLGSRIK